MKYKDLSLTWRGDVTSYSGTAQYARSFIKPLVEGGASVRLEMLPPIMPESELSPWWEEHFKLLSKNAPGDITITCMPIDKLKINKNEKTIVLTSWETKYLPFQINNYINSPEIEHVVVTNSEMLESSKGNIKVPMSLVKMPIEDLSKVDSLQITGVDSSTVLFGYIGEWDNRNNISDTIVAFFKAFTDKDNVALVLKTFSGNVQDLNERKKLLELIKKIKADTKRNNLPKVVVIQDVMGYDTIDSLIKRINIYVNGSRGDSKNISMLKALAMNKPVITCSHSANKPFFDNDNQFIYEIPYFYEPVMLNKGIYSISDSWSRIDCETFSKLMVVAYSDLLMKGNEIKESFKTTNGFIKNNYNVDRETAKLAKVIKEHQSVPVIRF